MLNIVINSNYDSAGTKVCIKDLVPRLRSAGHRVKLNDWSHYQSYNLALFMSPDAAVQQAKQQNPNIKTGIMNPMVDYPRLQANSRSADFLVVGSLEQRDAQLKYNKNIFIYYMFPNIKPLIKKHTASKPIIIGYHGNREHLINFHPHINNTLTKISQNFKIELWVMYNIRRYGPWRRHLPRDVKVKHIQWSPSVYHRQLSHCDIGLVNNSILQGRGFRHLITQPVSRYLNFNIRPYRAMDTLMRFKYSTNPGRIYPFSQLGIPVIADFAPSMSQFINDGKSGYIVNSPHGWYWAIKKLIEDHKLRQHLSNNLRKFIDNNYSIDQNFVSLNKFLIDQVND